MAKGKRKGKKRSKPAASAKNALRPGNAAKPRSPEPARSAATRARSSALAPRPATPATSDQTPKASPSATGRRFDTLPVVGMVASAGGLDAYIKFFDAMPADSGMAFILIPHLDPHRESMMAELLARHTAMPVREATDGVKLAPNRVYVIPPNKYLAIHEGALHLSGPLERAGLETAIDAFLRSLADDQQERAIGVILSGTGSHGTLGVKAIKANGGMVMVQDPKTADQDRMPQSAIDTGLADYVLAPGEMPLVLIKYARHFLAGGAAAAPPAAAADHLTQILALLRARTRFDFRSYRKRMLLRRVNRRMGLNHLDNVAEYLVLLRERPEEIKQLAKDLLICVTSFFRDHEMFRVLETQAIAELVRSKPAEAPIRVWVPACATGEEAYSIAMLFLEKIGESGKACPLQVFATDVEADALEAARQGIYSESVLADVSNERRARFFTKIDEHSYQVNKALRDAVLFAQQNLLSDAPFSKVDLVACRNLLIYLEPDVQQKVITLLHFALNEGGYLVLGPAETVGPQADLFESVSKKWRIYRRVGMARLARVEFPIEPGVTRIAVPPAVAASQARPASLQEITHELLVEDYAPAAALIRRNYQVLFFHGPTHLYLRQPAGAPTADLTTLAREGLRERIHAAVHKAVRQGRRVSIGGARVKRDGRFVAVRVSARPLSGPTGNDGMVLVSFEDDRSAVSAARARSKVRTEDETVERQLEHELKTTREALQSTIEELESANEELKASNEEIMSMNEELQSANEELETSKEELQSLNEELTTVNNQLQEKVDQLESANNDLANLLASTDTPTLFLAADHTIKRFTAAAPRLFRLISTDVGRPLRDISWGFADADFEPDIDAVLQNLTPREKEVSADDGHWYLRRITPYRTADHRIEGVVATFTDISAQKQAADTLRGLNTELELGVSERTTELAAERNFVTAVLETVGALVVVLDTEGRVVRCNKTCERLSGYRAEELSGQPLWDTVVLPEEQAGVQRVFEALRAGEFPSRYENHWRHRNGSTRLISWSNTCLLDARGHVKYVIGTGIDMTEQRRAEEEARTHQAVLAHDHRLMTAGELATALAHELNQPLAAIASYSEAGLQELRRGADEPDKLIRNLEQIALQAQRAGQTIRELRKFLARDEEQKREPVDVNALFHTVAGLMGPEARASGVRIVVEPTESPLTVLASPVQIEHVLVNLIQNAIEAIRHAGKPGGTVTMRVAAEAEGTAQVTVQDDGPGFDGEPPERLFERFYTTKPDGLGMGLVICHALVEAHGGKIWAECLAQGGAAFHFTLPRPL